MKVIKIGQNIFYEHFQSFDESLIVLIFLWFFFLVLLFDIFA